MSKYKIALDVMGDEFAIKEPIAAARKFIRKHPDTEITLVGNEQQIKELLLEGEFKVINANEVITNKDSLLSAKRKINTSLQVAIDLVKNNTCHAVVSAGATIPFVGMVYSNFELLDGIKVPGFMPWLPTRNKKGLVMCDVGATLTIDEKDYLNFALMTSVYAKLILNKVSPTVGILNIGTESSKGFPVHKAADELLSKSKVLNYQGFVEPKELLEGHTDIVLSDGYAGNLVLKALEGTMKSMSREIKMQFKKRRYILNALWALPVLKKIVKTFDYRQNAGAIVLGLKKIAVKTHGSADAEQFYSTLRLTRDAIRYDLINNIKNELRN